jgi:hypothetical protein
MIKDFSNNPTTNLSLFVDDNAIYKASMNLKFLQKHNKTLKSLLY